MPRPSNWLLPLLLCGCESLSWTGPEPYNLAAETEHRARYRATGDHDSLFWLLTHRVEAGMTIQQVEDVLGREGRREFDDLAIKTGGGYRTTDLTYRWGPDDRGRSVYLVFRDGRLVNFDPREFTSSVDPKRLR